MKTKCQHCDAPVEKTEDNAIFCGLHLQLKVQNDTRNRVRARIKEEQDKLKISRPEKNATRYATSRLIAKGFIQPKPCENCGQTERVQVHHLDYKVPEDVMWLCEPCHRQWHRDN